MDGITLEYDDAPHQGPGYADEPPSFRKAMILEHHIREQENPKKNTSFCKICKAELKTPMHAKTHYNSVNHKKNMNLLRVQLLEIPVEICPDLSSSKTHLESFGIQTGTPVAALYEDDIKFRCLACNAMLDTWQINNHVNDETHKRNLEFYCDICNLSTISKEALLEHNRFSHQHKLKVPNCNIDEDGPSIPQVYISPKISPKKLPKAKNTTQINLQQNAMMNCDVCHKIFETEQLFVDHQRIFPHIVLQTLKYSYPPEIVDAVCCVSDDNNILCSLCNVKMRNEYDTKTHLNGTKHTKRFKTAFKELCPEENTINSETNNVQTKVNIGNNKETSREYEVNNGEHKTILENISEKKTDNTFFYCYICKKEFESKAEINDHALSFPHVELAKLKSETVSSGVPYAEYWAKSDDSYSCTLCDAKLINASVLKHHCKAPNHKERLTQWCKDFATLKCNPVVDPKYFYCKTCDLALVGTTEAELHYKRKPHLIRVDLYCQTCNMANSTEKMFQDHKRSPTHQENLFKEIGGTMSSEARLDSNMDNQENCIDEKLNIVKEKNALPSDDSLKQQVYRELDKFIHILYYSKSLPYDISLEYLKKVNKEIEELKQKRQTGSSGKYLDHILEYKSCTGSFVTENFRKVEVVDQNLGDNKKLVFDKDVVTSTSLNDSTGVSKNSAPPITEDVPKKKSNSKKNRKFTKLNFIEDSQPNEGVLQVTKGDKPYRFGEEKEDVQKDCEYFEGFSDMLELIKSRKNRPNKFPDEDVDAELLNEFDTLIKHVASGDIPCDVILDYLQTCNEELDRKVEEYKVIYT